MIVSNVRVYTLLKSPKKKNIETEKKICAQNKQAIKRAVAAVAESVSSAAAVATVNWKEK